MLATIVLLYWILLVPVFMYLIISHYRKEQDITLADMSYTFALCLIPLAREYFYFTEVQKASGKVVLKRKVK